MTALPPTASRVTPLAGSLPGDTRPVLGSIGSIGAATLVRLVLVALALVVILVILPAVLGAAGGIQVVAAT